ncbi:hypothetical protein GCM10022222_14890 [Amycolatopsis ultiminotia]|uniref:Uncharacterized protein n=1 Tax=Amycolatopsis ultiminotia TaxID=543629 RepID=A0ABP6VCX0_9PSEU
MPPGPHAPGLDTAFSGFTMAAAKSLAAHGVGVPVLGRGTPVADRTGSAPRRRPWTTSSRAPARPTAWVGTSFMDNPLEDVGSIRDDGLFTGIATAGHHWLPSGTPLPPAASRAAGDAAGAGVTWLARPGPAGKPADHARVS